uniref:Uncharacterized protein n=1 Tax=Rhizophora mucronata TaxID=61149 RepID=A0A2P2IJL3_RHIMU
MNSFSGVAAFQH